MRIAVAYENGEIFGHFGHCGCFTIYDYPSADIYDCTKKLIDSSDRHGHAEIAELMRSEGVDAVIVGRMGDEAKSLLLSYGIIPVTGFCGSADQAADLLISGRLPIFGEEEACGGCPGCGTGENGECGCGGGCCG